MDQYINLTKDNIMSEHVCCAIADKKHQCGVNNKKEWLMNRLSEGHIFRKLDAKAQNKSGVCAIVGKKKTPFLTDKKFLVKNNFSVCDEIGDYELMYISFDNSKPKFRETAKTMTIPDDKLTIYYNKNAKSPLL